MKTFHLSALVFLLAFLQPSYGHCYLTNAQPLWLEAECATVGNGWQSVEDPTAAGGAYLVHSSGKSLNSPPSESADQLVFSVEAAVAGSYYLQARIRAPSGTKDSFWVRVNNGPWIKWWKNITRGSQFAWNRAPGAPFSLDAGNHTITVAYRESGTQLDKIVLNPSSGLPSGLGEMASCQTVEPKPLVAIGREAECALVGANWTLSEGAEASGEKYAVYPSGKSLSTPPSATADQLVFNVTVDQPQFYYLWARMNAPSQSSNSIWIRVDDQPWFKWWQEIATGKGFRWNVLPGGPLNLTVGSHTITVAYREAGTQLDKLSLSTNDSPPTGLGEADTYCRTTPAPPALVIAALSDTLLTMGEPYQQTIRATSGNTLGARVVVLGSSTAAGTGASNGQGWVNLLHNYLLTQVPNHQIFNLAVGGYTTRDVLATGNANHNITRALALSPSVILVNLPSNDVAKGISDAESMDNFAALRDAASAVGVPIYFTTTQPRNFGSLSQRNQLSAQATQIKALFAPNVVDIYDELADGNQRIKPQYGSGDGIHLNNDGHAFILAEVRRLFDDARSQEEYINLTVSGLPSFLTFTTEGSGLGTLSGIPLANDIGTYPNIVITATQAGSSHQREVVLSVRAPASDQTNEADGTTVNLVLAPNPTQDYAQIMVSDDSDQTLRTAAPSYGHPSTAPIYRVLLYNPGQELLLDELVSSEQTPIDIRTLPVGHYPVQVYQNGRLVFTEQLIIAR